MYLDQERAFEGLAGLTLHGIAVSEGEEILKLSFENTDPIYIDTEGDCCSRSWWADIIEARSNYGGVITGVRRLDLPEPMDQRTRSENDQVYGFALDTTQGSVALVFRNASNGYYGGWCVRIPEPARHTYFRTIDSNDWRA